MCEGGWVKFGGGGGLALYEGAEGVRGGGGGVEEGMMGGGGGEGGGGRARRGGRWGNSWREEGVWVVGREWMAGGGGGAVMPGVGVGGGATGGSGGIIRIMMYWSYLIRYCKKKAHLLMMHGSFESTCEIDSH